MIVASMATRAVDSMIPMRTGPRSDRNPTPDDAAARSTLTAPTVVAPGDHLGVARRTGCLRPGAPGATGRRAVTGCRNVPTALGPGWPFAVDRRIAATGRRCDGRTSHRCRVVPCPFPSERAVVGARNERGDRDDAAALDTAPARLHLG